MDVIVRSLESALSHLRFASRKLTRNLGSTVVAVIAMALGIALTATMFAIIDGILLRGLPFEEADRLVHLECNNLALDRESIEVSEQDFEDWRSQQKSFEGLAGFTSGTFNLADEGPPDRYNGAWISAGFLELLRETPVEGRAFTREDEQPGAAPVILIGHHVWQNRYGGDPTIIGRTIRVNSEPTTIVGVLPDGFLFPINHDAWMPLVSEASENPRGEGRTFEVFGRLADGVDIDGAASELAIIAKRLEQEYPESNEGVGALVQPYIHEFIGDDTRMLLGMMFVAVLMVLMIACFNVANLLIGRASLRQRELAIRSALGSGRWQAIASVLSEAGLISMAGAAIGVVLAHLSLRVFDASLAQTNPPFWFHFALSERVFVFALAIAAISSLLAGLVPALQASRPNVSQVLQDASRGSTSFSLGRASRAMVVLQVAISCALLLGAGLAVRSVVEANSYDLSFDTDNLLSARLGLFEGDYPEQEDRVAFWERLRDEVAARPEVESAAIGTVMPTEMSIGSGGTRFERSTETYERPSEMPFARLNFVGPGYFDTLGVKVLAGRDVSRADRQMAPAVALVNEDFARKEWPGENPIGKTIDLWIGTDEEEENPNAGWVEVIGVVPDLRFAEFDNEDDQQAIYLPMAQGVPHENGIRFAWIISRTKADPLAFAEPLRRTVQRLDADIPLYFVRSMDQVLQQTMYLPNLMGVLFSIFGVIALVLACVGLYGVMAFAVNQRIQEMGVRMALGAQRRDVLTMVLKQGLTRVAVGLVPGVLLGALMGVGLKAFLFNVRSLDPTIFVLIPIALILVAVIASLVPARRASSVDPVVALHYE